MTKKMRHVNKNVINVQVINNKQINQDSARLIINGSILYQTFSSAIYGIIIIYIYIVIVLFYYME